MKQEAPGLLDLDFIERFIGDLETWHVARLVVELRAARPVVTRAKEFLQLDPPSQTTKIAHARLQKAIDAYYAAIFAPSLPEKGTLP